MIFKTFIFHIRTKVPLSRFRLLFMLHELCDRLGLTKIGEPIIRTFPDHPNAYTILQVIAQSHVSIETWPELELVRVIVDSCSEVRYDICVEVFDQFLDPYWFTCNEVERRIEVNEDPSSYKTLSKSPNTTAHQNSPPKEQIRPQPT